MPTWPLDAHFTRRLTEREADALGEAVPTITAFGSSTEGNHWVSLECEGESLDEAATAARRLVEPALPAGVLVRVGHTDELMHDRQVLLWVRAARSALQRWEAATTDVVRSRRGQETDRVWRIWDCQIERHFCLIAANNLRRAVIAAHGRFTAMDTNLADAVWVLRDVNEHWDEQWPSFYDSRVTGERKRAGARFEQRHPGENPFVFDWWTADAGPMLGPELPSSQLHRYLDLTEAEVIALRPELSRFVSSEPTTTGRARADPVAHTSDDLA